MRAKNKNKSHLSVILGERKQENRTAVIGIRGCYMTNSCLFDLSALFSEMTAFLKDVIDLFSLQLSSNILLYL